MVDLSLMALLLTEMDYCILPVHVIQLFHLVLRFFLILIDFGSIIFFEVLLGELALKHEKQTVLNCFDNLSHLLSVDQLPDQFAICISCF